MSDKNSWAIIGVVSLVAVVAIFNNMPISGSSEVASVADSSIPNVPSVATQLQKVTADITNALATKSSGNIAAYNGEYQSAINTIALTNAEFKHLIDVAINKGRNVSAAQAALSDLQVKLSYLQSAPLSLQNGMSEVTSLNAAFADISTINTNLRAVGAY